MPSVRLSRVFVFPLLILAALMIGASTASAQARPSGVKGLPQAHEYQKQLRAFMATLTEKDFEPVQGKPIAAMPNPDVDELLRLWILSRDAPRIGAKRSAPSVNLPSAQFVLKHIEGSPDQTVIQPWVWAEPLVWLANWKYAGNPYQGSRALKLRAFVHVAIDLMMMDEQQEFSKAPLFHRADWFGPHLLMYAYTYEGVKDVLPPGARQAFETGIKKMVQRVEKWGPQGEETFFDIQNAVAMTILHQSMDDASIKPALEAYVKRYMTQGEFYNSAGYFADQGCFDTGFNGLTLYYATWIAVRTDWPWAKEAVARAWKLRGHLMLPEPDEKRHRLSPTHMTLRTASPVAYDQWNWPFKSMAASFVTDEAICQADWPTTEELQKGPQSALGGLNGMLRENPIDPNTKVSTKNEILKSDIWRWRLWTGSPVFPMVNYGHEHYPKGFAAHLASLQQKKSPLLKIPFERPGTFIEQFDKGFLIAKTKHFGVVIHTGPVSEYPGKVLEYPNAPYGLSGGTLSAFWTPTAGSTILGRRGGMSVPGGKATNFDKLEEWRTWPVHAVSGSTVAGKFFTSARIQKPDCTYQIKGDHATVQVGGLIPAAPIGKEQVLTGKLEYARTFTLDPEALRIETSIQGDGKDKVAELYEVIPAFHREESLQNKTVVAKIEFQSGGNWAPATTEYVNKVTAVRITRFQGAVVVQFDRGRRVKLSPAETGPGFLTGGVSRNILIDLLESNSQPTAIKGARTVRYTITPSKK